MSNSNKKTKPSAIKRKEARKANPANQYEQPKVDPRPQKRGGKSGQGKK